MIKLNLETKTKEQEIIKKYLEENASDILADKINNGVRITKDSVELINKKNLDGFMQYASDEARKLAVKEYERDTKNKLVEANEYLQGACITNTQPEAKRNLTKNSEVCSVSSFICIEDNTVFGWSIHYFEEDTIEGKLFHLDGSEYMPIIKTKSIQTNKTPTPPKKEDKPQMTLFDLGFSLDTQETIQEETEQDEIVICSDIEEEIIEEVIEEPKLTISPLYTRYMLVQDAYPNSIVANRIGDFYEFFGESAVKISSELDLTLTGRDLGLKERVPMCGIPYHRSEEYFNRIRINNDLVVIQSNKDNETQYLSKLCNESQDGYENIDLETGEVIGNTKSNDTIVDSVILTKLKNLFEDMLEVRL